MFHQTCAFLATMVLTLCATSLGQTLPPDPGPVPVLEILFSTRYDSPPGTVTPPPALDVEAVLRAPTDPTFLKPKQGDVLSERGYIAATNAYLLRNFHPMPAVPSSCGLDGLHECRATLDASGAPRYLFSIAKGFFDEALGVQISDGDLLSDSGAVVMTNAQLVRNFQIMPPVPPLGLDAFCVPYIYQPVSTTAMPEIWFSTATAFFSQKLNVQIQEGDLLSTTGRIVATNRQLMRNFHPSVGGTIDYGLDAVFVPKFNVRLNSAISPPEIWFSTKAGWYDAILQRSISEGDLLSTTGRVVRTNGQLMQRFFPPTMGPAALPNYGLDAVDVRLYKSDFNIDGSVDGCDYGHFAQCFNGTGNPIPDGCVDSDLDDDNDVDGADYGIFASEFTGTVSSEDS